MNLLKPTKKPNDLPLERPMPTPPLPIRARASQEAVAFGQRIIDLEDERDHFKEIAGDEERRAKLAEAERDRLLIEIEKLKTELDYYRGLWTATEAKFDAAASILLNVMQKRDPKNTMTQSATQAVATAIEAPPPPPSEEPHE